MTATWAPEDRDLLAGLSLSRGTLDRRADLRGDGDAIASAWDDPTSRVLAVSDDGAAVRGPAEAPVLALVSPAEVPDGAETVFLGVEGGTAFFMARSDLVPEGARRMSLREVGARLGDRDAGLLVTSVALDHWHAVHPRCSRCGEATRMSHAGWVRTCPADGSEHYPRTDPAVIMLVVDEDGRALLGRRAGWPGPWFSTLAGFVEPGESAEAAVRREIAEEAGVTVGDVLYLGSQPWPFPCSLMLGYHAQALTTGIQVDEEEIAEARWFSRDGLRDACAAGEVALPPAVSIARRLIERWYGEPLSGEWIRP